MKATTPTPSTGRSKQGKAGTQSMAAPPSHQHSATIRPARLAQPLIRFFPVVCVDNGLTRHVAKLGQCGQRQRLCGCLSPSRRRRQPPPGHHLHHHGRPIPPTLHLLHGFHACPVLSTASPTGTRHAGQFVPSRDPASPSPSIVCMAHESVNPPGRMLQDQGTSMLALERTMPGHKTARGHQAWRAARHPTRRRHAVRLGCSL